MIKISVNTKQKNYPIYIGDPCNFPLGDLIRTDQVCIVTDENVAPHYLEPLKSRLINKTCIHIILPAGEIEKNRDNLQKIYDALIEAHYSRDACIIALGGGVIGDMAGFAASTYQRGIEFFQYPTSLLAQVDSSVGGKVAINHPKGKNLIGAFYQPDAVFIDVHTLKTLPERELSAGVAEIIKYGAIIDSDFYYQLEKSIPKIRELDTQTLINTVKQCCEFKAKIVNLDETEKNTRMLLNFGHTFGHSIESLTHYKTYLHGEAISIGMAIAMRLSINLGYVSENDANFLSTLLKLANLPSHEQGKLTIDAIYENLFLDKKVRNGKLNLILLSAIGKAITQNDIEEKSIRSAINQHLSVN